MIQIFMAFMEFDGYCPVDSVNVASKYIWHSLKLIVPPVYFCFMNVAVIMALYWC